MPEANSHRQLLVRCHVENQAGEASVRYVEHSVYRLWQYMMANKHSIRVRSAAVCLWLPEPEWRSQSELFRRAGESRAVQRISLAIYDRDTGLCNTLQRFTDQADTDRVRRLLLDRVPGSFRADDDFLMEIDDGHAIARDGLADLVNLGYALTDARLTEEP